MSGAAVLGQKVETELPELSFGHGCDGRSLWGCICMHAPIITNIYLIYNAKIHSVDSDQPKKAIIM
jgi:hypothetical protein